jgi:RND family efflux transporter MFP subunit
VIRSVNRWFLALAVVCAAGIGVGAWQALSVAGTPAAASRPPPLVSVAVATSSDLPLRLYAQGHLVPLNQVDIRPQFNGIVKGVHFREGDAVSAGQLLFTLDASDATAQVEHARAQAAQMKAQLDDAGRDLARARQLVKDNFVSPSAVSTAEAKAETLQAQYQAAQADLGAARTAIDRARIVAPVSGLTGALSVHPGSLAQLSASAPLVTVVRIDPIGVEFALPEGNLPDLLAARAAGEVKVTLTPADGKAQDGVLVFVDNAVDRATGTILVKASFPNPRHLLWPGTFARVTVEAGTNRGAIVLPPQALLDGTDGRFVWVLGSDGKVSARPVTLLRMQEHQAVVQGLAAGTRVVAEGNQGLRPGAAVRVAP